MRSERVAARSLSLQDQQADVLQQVEKLSSHISRKDAMRKLNRMRKDKSMKEAFTNSIPIFILVHQLLADYRYCVMCHVSCILGASAPMFSPCMLFIYLSSVCLSARLSVCLSYLYFTCPIRGSQHEHVAFFTCDIALTRLLLRQS